MDVFRYADRPTANRHRVRGKAIIRGECKFRRRLSRVVRSLVLGADHRDCIALAVERIEHSACNFQPAAR
jgi:hypothetical protein